MSEVDKELEEKLGSVGRRLATLPSDVKELHLLLDVSPNCVSSVLFLILSL